VFVVGALLLVTFLIRLVIALLSGTVDDLMWDIAKAAPLLIAAYAIPIVLFFFAFLRCTFLSTLSRHNSEIGFPKLWQDYARSTYEKDQRRHAKRSDENQ
jgi:hypothetical protein